MDCDVRFRKNIITLILILFAGFSVNAVENSGTGIPNRDKWSEAQWRQYEDSIISGLYPASVEISTPAPAYAPCRNVPFQRNISPSVPTMVRPDTGLDVGEIPCASSVSPTGARIYEVPIDIYPGMRGFQPALSFVYNSQSSESEVGTGWSISGLSNIARCGKSIYYNGKTEGVQLNSADSFVLDGQRLVRTTKALTWINYQGEKDRTMARGHLLGDSSVSCYFGSSELRKYELAHSYNYGYALLTEIGCSAESHKVNPLRFYYGSQGESAPYFTSETTMLLSSYKFDKPESLKIVRGKIEYGRGMDGIIILNNKNPYWNQVRESGLFQHSQNFFRNLYGSDEKIFLYSCLGDNYATPFPYLTTGDGFIDIFCADLYGTKDQCVVKVNNVVENGRDKVVFSVYRPNVVNGIYLAYTRTYTFDTVHTDNDKNQSIHPKFYYTGDFNGDGLVDVIATPRIGDSEDSANWNVFYSDGAGHFDTMSPFQCGSRKNRTEPLFFLQDVDGDGRADIVESGKDSFIVHLTRNGTPEIPGLSVDFPASSSAMVPVDINAGTCFTRLISIKDDKVECYRYSENVAAEVLVTGMANSYGAVERSEYGFIDEGGLMSGLYVRNIRPSSPFVSILEPLPVLSASQSFVGDVQCDEFSYGYEDALIHTQGLGFCGFQKTKVTNRKGQTTTKTYDPFNSGALLIEESPNSFKSYTYDFATEYGGVKRIRVSSSLEKNLLTGDAVKSEYSYEDSAHDEPTHIISTYSDGFERETTNIYSSQMSGDGGYGVAFLKDQTVTVSKDGKSCSERKSTSLFKNRLPLRRTDYRNGTVVGRAAFSYDSCGNPLWEARQRYSSRIELRTSYQYDGFGRLVKATDPKGLTNTLRYDSKGRLYGQTDHRGHTTNFVYDPFGRLSLTVSPAGIAASEKYVWETEGTSDVLYWKKKTETGVPPVRIGYDALGREVDNRLTLMDGRERSIRTEYGQDGNVSRISLPTAEETPTDWNIYSYDDYNRLWDCYEASGRYTSYSYSGNKIETVRDGESIVRTYDARGNLIEAEDANGKVEYKLDPDGQPSSVTAIGGYVTNFGYDALRRQISIDDPSLGLIQYEYDSGGNLIKETDAKGETIEMAYDRYGRIISKTAQELTTAFSYDEHDQLSEMSSDNGTGRKYGYDSLGRLTSCVETRPDDVWFKHEYTYFKGNVSSIKYSSHKGELATEIQTWTNGYLSKSTLGDGTIIYMPEKQDVFGNITAAQSGAVKTECGFTRYGLPSFRKATVGETVIQSESYGFNHSNSTLEWRTDNVINRTERFVYDSSRRLTGFGDKTVEYDESGNITSISDMGELKYDDAGNPYAVTSLETESDIAPFKCQKIDYASFRRPLKIYEDYLQVSVSPLKSVITEPVPERPMFSESIEYVYDGDFNRAVSRRYGDGKLRQTKYYAGGCYELEKNWGSEVERLYLCGDYYEAPAALVKKDGDASLYPIVRDFQGSVTHVLDSDGKLVQQLRYDAWGRLRSKLWNVFKPGDEPTPVLGRGYCGHEHLSGFGLINMNARLYDPYMGRFLSPDPFVQAPDLPQAFNRFTYAMNSPLCCIDRDGKIWWWLVGAVIGGTVNVISKACSGQLHNLGDGLKAFGIGAVAGALGSAGALLGTAAVGATAWGMGGFWTGMVGGGVYSGVSMLVESELNHWIFHDPHLSGEDLFKGVLIGALSGGLMNGAVSSLEGRNFWTGQRVQRGEAILSFDRNPVSTEYDANANYQIMLEEQSELSNTGSSLAKSSKKPLEHHHFATDKNKTYTPAIKKITDKYDLNLNKEWNIRKLPHRGRHPNEYHEWVIYNMEQIDAIPNMNAYNFTRQVDIIVIQPVLKNPDMLYKRYWINNAHVR